MGRHRQRKLYCREYNTAVVDTTRIKALADSLIGPIFNRAVSDWDAHYGILKNFWSRTLLGTTRYKDNPFAPHTPLGLKPEYFVRWIDIFKATALELLQPAAAQRAIAKVEHMGACFQAGLFLPTPHDKVAAAV